MISINYSQLILKNSGDSQGSATECQIRAVPAFCYYIFRPCVIRENNVIRRSERLCREDCELLKRDVCREEYLTKGNIFSAVKMNFKTFIKT